MTEKDSSFKRFMRDLQAEAEIESPKACEELMVFSNHFLAARELIEARQIQSLIHAVKDCRFTLT